MWPQKWGHFFLVRPEVSPGEGEHRDCSHSFASSDTLTSDMRSFEIPSAFLPIFLASLTVPGMAQSPQSKPSTTPFAMPAQMTQAQQDNFPQQLINELTQIKSAALEDEYAYRQVAHLTENIGPRPSGSVQAKAAVDYVAAELRNWDSKSNSKR